MIRIRISLSVLLTVSTLAVSADEVAPQMKIATFAAHVYEVMAKRNLTLTQAVEAFKACGVTGFDGAYTDPRLDELKAAGLKPVMLYGSPSFRNPDEDEPEQEKYLARARSLGVEYMMIVPDHLRGVADDPKDPEYERGFVRTLTGLKRFVAKCRAAGICPVMEDFGCRTNPGSHFGNLKRYFAEIPGLMFVLDTGNAMSAERGTDILDMFEYFYGKIRHVHVKDHPAGDPGGYALPGEGVVPNARMLRRLFLQGYGGWVTLELFDAPDMLEAVTKASAFVRSCRVAPKKPLLIGLSDAFEPAWSTNVWPTISGTCLSYVDAIGKAGHVPIILCRTYDTNTLEKVMVGLDLLLMTGGGDVDPGRYGEDNRRSYFRVMYDRDRFDYSLLDIARRRHIPVLGICRGAQIMNVYFGGTLCQDIPSQWQPKTTIRHSRQPNIYAHTIDIEPDSRLAKVLGGVTKGVKVGSEHHQCVKRPAPGFRIVARAPDGVIEGIEHETLPFAGLQFHPEGSVSIHDDPLLWKIYRDPLAFVVPRAANVCNGL